MALKNRNNDELKQAANAPLTYKLLGTTKAEQEKKKLEQEQKAIQDQRAAAMQMILDGKGPGAFSQNVRPRNPADNAGKMVRNPLDIAEKSRLNYNLFGNGYKNAPVVDDEDLMASAMEAAGQYIGTDTVKKTGAFFYGYKYANSSPDEIMDAISSGNLSKNEREYLRSNMLTNPEFLDRMSSEQLKDLKYVAERQQNEATPDYDTAYNDYMRTHRGATHASAKQAALEASGKGQADNYYAQIDYALNRALEREKEHKYDDLINSDYWDSYEGLADRQDPELQAAFLKEELQRKIKGSDPKQFEDRKEWAETRLHELEWKQKTEEEWEEYNSLLDEVEGYASGDILSFKDSSNEVFDNYWLMTPEERLNYYKIANHPDGGSEKANEYFYALKPKLDDRMTQDAVNAAAELDRAADDIENPWLRVPGQVLTKTGSFLAGATLQTLGSIPSAIGDVVNGMGGTVRPNDAWHLLSNYGRAFGTAQKEDIDIAFDPKSSPIMNGVAQFMYDAASSAVQNLIGAYTFGSWYTWTMAAGAADQTLTENWEKGERGPMLIAQTIIDGAISYATETWGVENFIGEFMETPTANKIELIKKVMVQAGIEISEEIAEDILTYMENEILGTYFHTQYAEEYNALRNAGWEDKEIDQYLFVKGIKDRARNYAIAGVSAGASGAAANVMNYRETGKYYNPLGAAIEQNSNTQALVDTAKDFEAAKTNATVQKILKDAEKGKKLTLRQIGMLFDETASGVDADTRTAITDSMKEGIAEELGEDNPELVEAITKKAMSEELTAEEEAMLEEYDSSVTEEAPAETAEGEIDPAAEKPKQRKKADDVIRSVVNSEKVVNTILSGYQKLADISNLTRTNQDERKGVDADDLKVSTEGKNLIEKDGTTSEVNISGIDSIKDGKIYFKTEDGSVVDGSEVSFANRQLAITYQAMKGTSTDVDIADKLWTVAQAAIQSGESSEYLGLGIREMYQKGLTGVAFDTKTRSAFANEIPAEVQKQAYNIGHLAYEMRYSQMERQKAEKAARQAALKNRGNVHNHIQFDGLRVVSRDGKQIQIAGVKLSANQQNDLRLAEFLGTIGKDVHVYMSKEGDKVNGYYKGKDGSIHIDLAAGANRDGLLAYTLAHEITHQAEVSSPEKMKVFTDALFKELKLNDYAVDARIMKKAYELLDDSDPNASYHGMEMDAVHKDSKLFQELMDDARSEFIAESCESMFTDTDAAQRIMNEIEGKDKGLATKIKKWFKDMVRKLREFYDGLDPDSDIAIAVRPVLQKNESLVQLWAEAVADDYMQSIGEIDLSKIEGAIDADGKQLLQIRAFKADEDIYKQMLLDHKIMSRPEIDALFKTIDKAVKKIENNLEILDYAWDADIDDRAFNPVKANSDNLYKVSLDFSTLCRKRILQQTVQAELQALLGKQLSKEETIAIRDELMKVQEEGRKIEVACALCYVESARMKSPEQIKRFLENRSQVIREFFAGQDKANMNLAVAEAEKEARNDLVAKYGGDARLNGKNLMTMSLKEIKSALGGSAAEAIRNAKRQAKAAYTVSAEQQRMMDAAEKMTVSDFTTPEGLANLKKNYRSVYDAFTSYIRNATKSKGIEGDTWFRAGDTKSIGDTLIENMNRENGLRSQSWSDFQVIHLMDYVASIIELSTRNAKMQAYTKVPDYVRLMGKTGVMINLSLIPSAEFNGTLEYDSTEGIDFKTAIQLRNQFPDTAGTICIGMDDEQIRMLLGSMDIDYVIPYRHSGMSKDTRKLMHIPSWKSYQDIQGEKKLSNAAENAKKHGVKLDTANMGKHPNFSEWYNSKRAHEVEANERSNPSDKEKLAKYGDMYPGYMAMQDAANRYLELCAERGLQPKFPNMVGEENYWKLLIDRKMVNNKTGSVIDQRRVKPMFDEKAILGILNDELKRYPQVKADQDYAREQVVDRFMSGKMNIDADTQEAIAKTVDNVTEVNIQSSSDTVLAEEQISDALTVNGDLVADQTEIEYDHILRSTRVKDKNVLKSLDEQEKNGEVFHTFRSMQLIDGKLFPPMAAVINGKYEDPSEIGVWEMSVEHPELIDKDGKFVLNKGKGKGTVPAAYNPYMHSSNVVLNDQFTSAFKRPNLVTVECVVPYSEANGTYWADKAKDPTGWHSWKAGPVATKVNEQTGLERQVFLSRYLMPVRILSNEEVAQKYKEILGDTDIAIPDNVVSPSLLDALRKAGVPIEETGMIAEYTAEQNASYQKQVAKIQKAAMRIQGMKTNTEKQVAAKEKAQANYQAEVEKLHDMVVEAALANGVSDIRWDDADPIRYNADGTATAWSDLYSDDKVLRQNRGNRYKTSLEISGRELYNFERLRYQAMVEAETKFDNIPERWYVKTNDAFYVYDNASKEDYTLRYKIHLRGNEEYIDSLREEIKNAVIESTEVPSAWAKNLRVQRGYNYWHNDSTGVPEDAGRNDGLDGRKPESNRAGAVQQSGANQRREYLGYSLDDILGAIRWHENRLEQMEKKLNDAYTARERKVAQAMYDEEVDRISTLENYTDILSVNAFHEAMHGYMTGDSSHYLYSTRKGRGSFDTYSDRVRHDAAMAVQKAENAADIKDLKAQHDAETENLKAEHRSEVKSLEDKVGEIKRQWDEEAEAIAKSMKYDAEQEIREVKEQYQASRKRAVENRKMTALRNKVIDMGKKFDQMARAPKKADSKHAPVMLSNALAQFCDIFNDSMIAGVSSKSAATENARVQAQLARKAVALEKLKAEYAKLKTDATESYYYDEAVHEMLEQMTNTIAGKGIYDLSMEELGIVHDTMRAFYHTITNANKLTRMGKDKTLVGVATKMAREIDMKKVSHSEIATLTRDYLMWQMTPDTFWSYICGNIKNNEGKAVQKMFADGSERMIGVQREFYQRFRHLTESEDKNTRKLVARLMSDPMKTMVSWGLKDASGKEVKTSIGMMLNAWMMLNQKDSFESLIYGGFKLADEKTYYAGKTTEAYSNADESELVSEAIGKSLGEMKHDIKVLNEQMAITEDEAQKAEIQAEIDSIEAASSEMIAGAEARLLDIRDKIKTVIDEQLGDTGWDLLNTAADWYKHTGELMTEVWVDMYGFQPKLNENYIPIHRNTGSIKIDMREGNADITRNLENSGFTKERVRSTAPILLTDFFEELSRQRDNIARYYGFAQVQKDFNKIWNTRVPGVANTLKEKVEDKFGKGSRKLGVSGAGYVDNYIADVANSRHSEDLLGNFYGNSAAATLSLNPRVALSQLASIPTAASIVGWKSMAVGAAKGMATSFSKKGKAQLANDSVWFYQRYKGAGGITEFADLQGKRGLWGKALNSRAGKLLFNWCQSMDVMATASMWAMAEDNVKSRGISADSEGYQAAVEQTYADIIRKSQPNYTVTERSDLLRDKRGGMKILTMYKTQSNQNLNILINANAEFKRMKQDLDAGRNGVTQADVKAAGKQLANAYTSVSLGGTVAFVMLRMLANMLMGKMDPYKDEETGEVTVGGLVTGGVKEIGSSLTGMFALGGNIYDFVWGLVAKDKYYGISDSAIGNISSALEKTFTLMEKVLDPEKEVTGTQIWNASKSIFTVFGLPANNVMNIYNAGKTLYDASVSGSLISTWNSDASKKQYRARILNAWYDGDTDKIDDALAELAAMSSKDTDEDVQKDVTHGFANDFLKDAFMKGDMDEAEAVELLEYIGHDSAESVVAKWAFQIENPEYSNPGDNMVSGYNNLKTVPGDVFLEAYAFKSNVEGDKDENGKTISGSAKQKVVDYIQGLNLNSTQKRELWDAVKGSWADKDTPWGEQTAKSTSTKASSDKYTTYGKPAGMTESNWNKYATEAKKITKKWELTNYINSLNISDKEKAALWQAFRRKNWNGNGFSWGT